MLDQEREKKDTFHNIPFKKNILAFIQPNFISNSILNLSPSISFMPRKKRKKEKKAKTHSSPLPSHHQTQSSPPLKKKSLNIDSFPRTISFLTKMASSSRNRIADTGLTRPFDRGSEASDRQRGGKKGGQKKRAADRCPTISNVTRNGQVTTSLSSPFPSPHVSTDSWHVYTRASLCP